eukprot:CAMPEP_0206043342 /NCGR_PEP_ID=MMETSP1466-20131121/8595_1 /ASSEMBLY_ACC=CAM_ASM_001126 /TAXON_ID=44452 /ORGANISM="Pavlova gyrans, Strain CCMP608" /LENGTH=266 /DNA_ID=CAMNT_0053418141 /DNA_START=30 /DNA_END=827 /DNA_ORIENTATION=-
MEGHVCLNILREDWKPVLTINSVIYGLTFLMLEPNADDPLNKEAAQLLEQNRRQFEQVVRRSLRGGVMRVGAQSYTFAPLVASEAAHARRARGKAPRALSNAWIGLVGDRPSAAHGQTRSACSDSRAVSPVRAAFGAVESTSSERTAALSFEGADWRGLGMPSPGPVCGSCGLARASCLTTTSVAVVRRLDSGRAKTPWTWTEANVARAQARRAAGYCAVPRARPGGPDRLGADRCRLLFCGARSAAGPLRPLAVAPVGRRPPTPS